MKENGVFVSMPFGDEPESMKNEWTSLYDFGLKPIENLMKDNNIVLLRADRDLEGLSLKENVTGLIDKSCFVLCVLTTSVVDGTHGIRLSNPNVLWELGYSEAIGKPIVVLIDNSSLRDLPVLAGQPNACVYHSRLIGTDSPEVDLKQIAPNLQPHFKKALEMQKHPLISRGHPHADIFANRDAINLPELIGEARKNVDILTTNLSYFLTDKLFIKTNSIKQALDNGAVVRVVTMDPESVIAEYRAKQLQREQNIPGYRRELRDGIISFFRHYGSYENFYLRVYNDLPLQITLRIDETIITSLVTRGQRARTRIHTKFDINEIGVTDSFLSHFQTMFDTSIDVAGLLWVVTESSSSISKDVPIPVEAIKERLGPKDWTKDWGQGQT